MSQPFVGQIDMFGGNFAPKGFAMCNGQIMSISQNQALFSLIGTYYGGNGVSTFALPDLQSRLPIHEGQGPGLSNYVIGQPGGTPQVTLNTSQIPQHMHMLNAAPATATATTIGSTVVPATATGSGSPLFYCHPVTGQPAPSPKALATGVCGMAGQSQPHANLMPSLCITFIIALQGVFPSRG
ncbi:MAG: phage tail protein [Proteobacteria bacterium]|nr:phage tail protein [Pseudomonadota bacterium]